ncbi:hypothetical protein D3C85_1316960 [compost metagenome]
MRRHRGIDPVFEQRVEHLPRIADLDADRHGRVAFPERSHAAQDVVGAGGANPQAAQPQVAGVAEQEIGLALLLHHLFGQRHQGHADVAEVKPAGAAVEQFHAVEHFQLADAAGDSGLAEPQLPGRARDAALPRHFIERHQQIAKHGAPIEFRTNPRA